MSFLFGQRLGDRGSAGWRSVGAEDLPADAGAEAGPFHAGPAEAAGGADEDHGQRGHLLHAAHALHLHLQVGRASDRASCLTLKIDATIFRKSGRTVWFSLVMKERHQRNLKQKPDELN